MSIKNWTIQRVLREILYTVIGVVAVLPFALATSIVLHLLLSSDVVAKGDQLVDAAQHFMWNTWFTLFFAPWMVWSFNFNGKMACRWLDLYEFSAIPGLFLHVKQPGFQRGEVK